MNSIAACALASGTLILGLTYPHPTVAQGLNGTEFAAWSEDSQNGFMQTSLTMAGIVFTQTSPEHSACINDRYFAEGRWDGARDELRATILQNSDAHPGGVILAVILRDCGPLE